jgi:glycosyltransferase involved in cell wall biosynthesis
LEDYAGVKQRGYNSFTFKLDEQLMTTQPRMSQDMDMDAKRTRVMIIITGLGRGGAERQVLRIVCGLASKFEFLVVSLVSGGELISEFRAAGIDVRELNMKSGLGNLSNINGYLRVLREVVSFRPDIIHGWLLDGNVAAVIAGTLSGTKTIASKRGSNKRFGRLRSLGEQFGLKGADCVMTNSSQLKSEICQSGVSEQRVTVIPNGIPMHPAVDSRIEDAAGTEARITVGTVGRFVVEKRYDDLLDAAKILLPLYPNLHFLFVGGRGDFEKYRNQIKRDGLSDRFTFTGEVKNVYPLLEQMDVFVLASSQEGMPNVIMEAMVLAKPVVATRVGAIPDLVVDGVTGILVEPYAPEQLAQSLQRLLDESGLIDNFGQAGRERIADFSVEKLLSRVESLYESLIR